MTPLARLLLKDLTLPPKRRVVRDHGSLLEKMDDIHCFECSQIVDAAYTIWDHKGKTHEEFKRDFGLMMQKTCFLPAPKTWIEFEIAPGRRLGWLIIESGSACDAYLAQHCKDGNNIPFTFDGKLELPNTRFDGTDDAPEYATTLIQRGVKDKLADLPMAIFQQEQYRTLLIILLAFINTPRVVGREQHMPHRGLERDLLRAMKSIGKFPIHDWTEIKLNIAVPKDMSDDSPVEAHLTGQRAYHFCRAYIRVRLGKLEIVSSYWSGNKDRGIKQSHYKLEDRSHAGCVNVNMINNAGADLRIEKRNGGIDVHVMSKSS